MSDKPSADALFDLGAGGPDKTVVDPTAATSRTRTRTSSAPNDPRRVLNPKPAASTLALPAGFRLFEYRIDGILGQGGFGIAYAATDVHLNASVVIKEYLPEGFAYRAQDNSIQARDDFDQEFYQSGLDSFLVEARTLAWASRQWPRKLAGLPASPNANGPENSAISKVG